MLSNTAMVGIWRSLAVIRLRHSSSLSLAVITETGRPVTMAAMISIMRPAPVPASGFSMR
jgi:hypothetical protein